MRSRPCELPARTVVALVSFLSMTGCLEATQITFDITTDIPCDQITATTITVGLDGETERVAPSDVSDRTKFTVECSSDGTVGAIGTFTVYPKEKNDTLVSVKVVAGVGADVDVKTDCTLENGYKGCVVARRLISYVPHRTLTVPVKLLQGCRDVPCDAKSSCNIGGRCATSLLDNTKCDAKGVCTEFQTTDTTSIISPALTEISLSRNPASTGDTEPVVVTVTLKDELGVIVPSTTEKVLVTDSPSTLGTWQGTGFVSDVPGIYTRGYKVGTKSGTVSFSGKVNSARITSGSPTLKIDANLQKSTLDVPQKIVATASTDQTLTLTLKDAADNAVDLPNLVVTGTVTGATGLQRGTLASGGVFTRVSAGVFSAVLTSPASLAGCTMAPFCTDSISVTVTHPSINSGMPTAAGREQRVQWGIAATLGTPPGQLTMNNVGAIAGSPTATVSGVLKLFNSTGQAIQVGGFASSITAVASFPTPPIVITDNDDGTYLVAVPSPAIASMGTLTVTVTAKAVTNGVQNITFFGVPDVTKSELTLSAPVLSGPISVSTVTAQLRLKDMAGNPITTLVIPATDVAFSVTGEARVSNSVISTVTAMSTVYSQEIARPPTPEIDFETVTVSAQIRINGTWVATGIPQTLLITPLNLAGVTIDCSNLATYRNQNIYVGAGTLTIDSWLNGAQPLTGGCAGFGAAPFTFKKVVVGPGGILTHLPGSSTEAKGLDIVVTDSVEIRGGGKINADNKGIDSDCPTATASFYFNGSTVVSAGPRQGGGGSHGGSVVGAGLTMPAFGVRDDPNEPGASAGQCGFPGGGLIRIKAKSFINNGVISAKAVSSNISAGGGGGGISIRVEPGQAITGTGSYIAAGGTGFSGYGANPGAGGRIALHGTTDTLKLSDFNVNGGGTANVYFGNPGTLFFDSKLADYTLPHVLNVGSAANDSVIPFDATTNWVIPLGIANGQRTILQMLDVTNTVTEVGNVTVFGDWVVNSPVSAGNVTVKTGGIVRHSKLTSSYLSTRPRIDIAARGIITVEEGGSITAAKSGYPGFISAFNPSGCANGGGARPLVPDAGTGFTCELTQAVRGGNHSVAGGSNQTGFFWGDAMAPMTYGGGGSRASPTQGTAKCGSGGGIVKLSAQSLVLNGGITADGEDAVSPTDAALIPVGAGAGGSINICVSGPLSSPMNTGFLSAKGGSAATAAGEVHGGAGGLIKLATGSKSGTIAIGSAGGPGVTGGLDGTSTTPVDVTGVCP